MSTTYTAWSLTDTGPEEIETYSSLDAAIVDILRMWPEDETNDVSIADHEGQQLVYMAHDDEDSAICHVVRDDGPDAVFSEMAASSILVPSAEIRPARTSSGS